MNKIKSVFLSLLVFTFFCCIYFVTYRIIEPKIYDFFVRNILVEKLPFDNHKHIYGHDDIILAVIDDKTTEQYRWPWKRDRFNKLFEYFTKYSHPKAIMFDVLIVGEDKENKQSDKSFYNTINKMNNLVVAFSPSVQSWEDEKLGKLYDKAFKDKYSLRNVHEVSKTVPYLYSSMFKMPNDYINVVKHVGSVKMVPGDINGNIASIARDEIFRTQEYISYYNNDYYPSLAFSTFLLVNEYPEIMLDNNSIFFPKLNYRIKTVNTDYQRIVPTKYYKLYEEGSSIGYSHQKYSVVDIMNSYDNLCVGKKPVLDASIFDDKIVVIGGNVTGGAGLNDNKSSPLRLSHPGVDYQATALDNLMYHDFLFVLPNFVNVLIAILGMFLVYLSIKKLDLFKAITTSIAIIFLYILICTVCFYFDVIINVITPVVMFFVAMIFSYTHKYFLENKIKEKVKSAMGKYISEDIMKSVLQNIDELGLGGKKATVTVLFADIRGFTTISEQMSAQQVSEFLNEYFSEMEPIITKYNGIINKFIGDAIMAVFGEPIQDTNHAQNAVKCGYAMLKRVEALHSKWSKENKPEIEIGVGINTGEVFIGNIGSVNRMEYTVIGDTVNLASRLESYNKTYKTKMLVSASTYQKVKSFSDAVKIPDVQIRGKANKMDIYEIIKVKLN